MLNSLSNSQKIQYTSLAMLIIIASITAGASLESHFHDILNKVEPEYDILEATLLIVGLISTLFEVRNKKAKPNKK